MAAARTLPVVTDTSPHRHRTTVAPAAVTMDTHSHRTRRPPSTRKHARFAPGARSTAVAG
jgi:hypothetical protein